MNCACLCIELFFLHKLVALRFRRLMFRTVYVLLGERMRQDLCLFQTWQVVFWQINASTGIRSPRRAPLIMLGRHPLKTGQTAACRADTSAGWRGPSWRRGCASCTRPPSPPRWSRCSSRCGPCGRSHPGSPHRGVRKVQRGKDGVANGAVPTLLIIMLMG